MQFYQHSFNNVEDYLHHRPPYLLIERIISISPVQVVTEKKLHGDEFFLAGHFPGAPILPGAMMQEMTTQSAGVLIAANYNPMPEYNTHDPKFNEYALGVLVKVKQARYKSFARPGDQLQVSVNLEDHIDSVFEFSAIITIEGREIMRNAFQLMNVKSSALIGE